MKIVYVTPEYIDEMTSIPLDGGLAQYLSKITIALSKLGHNVCVVIPNAAESKEVDYNGVRVIFGKSKTKIPHAKWQGE